MTVSGMSQEDKIAFLDLLIGKTDSSLRQHFYALYVAMGDDIFLLFALFSGITVHWPGLREFRSAHVGLEKMAKRRVEPKNRNGRTGAFVPQAVKVLDVTDSLPEDFWEKEGHETVPASHLTKDSIYFSEFLGKFILVLAPVRSALGREFILYADEAYKLSDVRYDPEDQLDSFQLKDF